MLCFCWLPLFKVNKDLVDIKVVCVLFLFEKLCSEKPIRFFFFATVCLWPISHAQTWE